MRAYLAILIAFLVGAALAAVAVSVLRLVGPDALLVQKGRLPGWWRRLTAWSRSRSLRVWCPDETTARSIAAQLSTETGRRLSRLGVSLAPGPWAADVLVVEQRDEALLDLERANAPSPVAAIMLVDATDPGEFPDAIVALAAALRWPDEDVAP